jgi:DNA-binding NarL/FixJ family response regulator
MKNILILDDHPIFLQGISMVINASSLEVSVKTTTNLSTAKQELQKRPPDLLLLDLLLPDTEGFTGLQEIISDYPSQRIAILSSSEDKVHIQTTIKYGVKGYIFKTLDFDEVLVAIETLLAGGAYLPKSTSIKPKKRELTARQFEILNLVSHGFSNQNIAKRLYISESTVKKHLNATFKILNVKNRIQAAQYLSVM